MHDNVPETIYYRFVNPSADVVYSEKLTLAYDNPATQIVYRNILVFDADDNVVKAGKDENLDGTIDAGRENNFVHQQGDLTGAQFYNGTSRTFDYSAIVDNMGVLDDNSYGKRVRRAVCAENYAWLWQDGFSQSRHLPAEAALQHSYVVPDNGFYKKNRQHRI